MVVEVKIVVLQIIRMADLEELLEEQDMTVEVNQVLILDMAEHNQVAEQVLLILVIVLL